MKVEVAVPVTVFVVSVVVGGWGGGGGGEGENKKGERSLVYWVVQAGMLTPLTLARHRLSPLAAFTSGAYFLHNGRR